MAFDGGFDGVPPSGGGGGDADPPTDAATTPVSIVYTEVASATVDITVVDAASAIGFVAIAVKYASREHVETIMLGVTSGGAGTFGGFLAPYDERSTITGGGEAGGGYTFKIAHNDGWPENDVAQFIVKATDTAGNILA